MPNTYADACAETQTQTCAWAWQYRIGWGTSNNDENRKGDAMRCDARSNDVAEYDILYDVM